MNIEEKQAAPDTQAHWSCHGYAMLHAHVHEAACFLRRSLLAIVLMIAFLTARSAHAQPALVQTASLESVQSDIATLVPSTAPVPGNVLVAVCATATAQTLDSMSPGWLIAIDESANGPGQAMLYKVADAADAAGITIRYSAATRLGMQLFEYSGIDTAAPIQAVASASGADVTPSTGSVTTLQSGEMVVAGLVVLTADPVSGWTGGFVEQHNFFNSSPPRAAATYLGADLTAGVPGSYGTSVGIAGRKKRWRGQVVALSPSPTISVAVTNGTFDFATQPPDIWLAPASSLVINDGQVTENFLCRVSPFTDGSNTWAVDPAVNGPDQIQVQWSTTDSLGPWTGLAIYDTDFSLATAVPMGDTVYLWFRIRTPTTTSSFNNHGAGLTITAEAN